MPKFIQPKRKTVPAQELLRDLKSKLSTDDNAELDSGVKQYLNSIELSRYILETRQRLGLSQAALGQRAGLAQTEVSKFERRLGNPTLETMLKLAIALDLTLEFTPARGKR